MLELPPRCVMRKRRSPLYLRAVARHKIGRGGSVYFGQRLGEEQHVQGERTWPDGAKYAGQWSHGKAHGMGRFESIEGDVYEGQWLNGKCHGHASYQRADGYKQEGQWEDDKQHGTGTHAWPDGSKYTGLHRQVGLRKRQGLLLMARRLRVRR